MTAEGEKITRDQGTRGTSLTCLPAERDSIGLGNAVIRRNNEQKGSAHLRREPLETIGGKGID